MKNLPLTLAVQDSDGAKISDFYEWSMADANIHHGTNGIQTIFHTFLRKMPTNKIIGEFERNGIKYPELTKRKFMINAGLEQAIAYILYSKNGAEIKEYFESVMQNKNQLFLDWATNMKFSGSIYAMEEGRIFFEMEPQFRVEEKFEESQVFESLILQIINRQTNVATTANDIAMVAEGKALLEGSSRRATCPQDALFISRAARIGGFSASSNVKFGINYQERVGGTHGHSYIMLHRSQFDAFKAQAEFHQNHVVFLLDTYVVKEAVDEALKIVQELKLKNFGFRIDSGDLLSQALWIHEELKNRGYKRTDYTLFASDDLTAGRIKQLEDNRAGIDNYLVGTFLSNIPSGPGIVYKISSRQENDFGWTNVAKVSETKTKSTLGGKIQVYRITDDNGYYLKDIIAIQNENISSYMEPGNKAFPLLVPILDSGKLVYIFPNIREISELRANEFKKFKGDIESYPTEFSKGLKEVQEEIRNRIKPIEV